ncbi:hypothetical protein GDO78_022598 [Eleutherodactylus coqui]|uniref:Uncharacterized protein n=1 Tax=Eleutherodactylus coqui TaxID=57060 RepID=A0A8J6EM13_ELECQ|nr:hypothetical protein GDO78_022598 [Eleutherodactylus coqui]
MKGQQLCTPPTVACQLLTAVEEGHTDGYRHLCICLQRSRGADKQRKKPKSTQHSGERCSPLISAISEGLSTRTSTDQNF